MAMTREEDDLSRIGVSLPGNLLEQFDGILNCRGYTSRSEGIRDAIRTYTINYQWLSDSSGERKGVITLVYHYKAEALFTAITEIRYAHREIIRTSLQTAVCRDKRLEVLLVQGTGAQLRELADLLMAQKGIESVRVTTTPLSRT
jgi:CopG family transcriptional regulator, nickel-responsive regulator